MYSSAAWSATHALAGENVVLSPTRDGIGRSKRNGWSASSGLRRATVSMNASVAAHRHAGNAHQSAFWNDQHGIHAGRSHVGEVHPETDRRVEDDWRLRGESARFRDDRGDVVDLTRGRHVLDEHRVKDRSLGPCCRQGMDVGTKGASETETLCRQNPVAWPDKTQRASRPPRPVQVKQRRIVNAERRLEALGDVS
jgi:hypothetical protein